MRNVTAIAALALFAACTPEEQAVEDYSQILPGEELLVDLPAARRAAGDPSGFLAETTTVATDVNTFIGDTLDAIGAITEFEPTWADDGADKVVWGPWADAGVEGMLAVERFEDDHYEWALLGRPEGADDDAWVGLIGGEVDPGATETTGSGTFGVDFDAWTARDPALGATGMFVSTYDVRDDGTDAEAAFENFSDPTISEPINAGYRYGEGADGGYMDFAYEANIDDGGMPETVILRSRWVADGAGRGDAYFTGGDLGALVYQVSECWDSAGVVVFDENNAELTTTGDVSACAYAEPQWSEEGV